MDGAFGIYVELIGKRTVVSSVLRQSLAFGLRNSYGGDYSPFSNIRLSGSESGAHCRIIEILKYDPTRRDDVGRDKI